MDAIPRQLIMIPIPQPTDRWNFIGSIEWFVNWFKFRF